MDTKFGKFLLYVVAPLGIFSVWLLTPWINLQFLETSPYFGTTGDMFGSVNALFSALALVGIIVAIVLQGNELKLQREELSRSTDAQESASRALADRLQLEKEILYKRVAFETASEWSSPDNERHREIFIRMLFVLEEEHEDYFSECASELTIEEPRSILHSMLHSGQYLGKCQSLVETGNVDVELFRLLLNSMFRNYIANASINIHKIDWPNTVSDPVTWLEEFIVGPQE